MGRAAGAFSPGYPPAFSGLARSSRSAVALSPPAWAAMSAEARSVLGRWRLSARDQFPPPHVNGGQTGPSEIRTRFRDFSLHRGSGSPSRVPRGVPRLHRIPALGSFRRVQPCGPQVAPARFELAFLGRLSGRQYFVRSRPPLFGHGATGTRGHGGNQPRLVSVPAPRGSARHGLNVRVAAVIKTHKSTQCSPSWFA